MANQLNLVKCNVSHGVSNKKNNLLIYKCWKITTVFFSDIISEARYMIEVGMKQTSTKALVKFSSKVIQNVTLNRLGNCQGKLLCLRGKYRLLKKKSINNNEHQSFFFWETRGVSTFDFCHDLQNEKRPPAIKKKDLWDLNHNFNSFSLHPINKNFFYFFIFNFSFLPFHSSKWQFFWQICFDSEWHKSVWI